MGALYLLLALRVIEQPRHNRPSHIETADSAAWITNGSFTLSQIRKEVSGFDLNQKE